MLARYASYIELAEIIRIKFKNPSSTLRELFGRLVFNILCGNTDDHARNHAAFWDGEKYNLTPAYDICPQYRAGNESSQAMVIYKDKNENSNLSLLENAIRSCAHFSLTEVEAIDLIKMQLKAIGKNWAEVCTESKISKVDRALLENTFFLNPYIFQGESTQIGEIGKLAESVKGQMKMS
jgi:serine/threonine-protein kinase HipA